MGPNKLVITAERLRPYNLISGQGSAFFFRCEMDWEDGRKGVFSGVAESAHELGEKVDFAANFLGTARVECSGAGHVYDFQKTRCQCGGETRKPLW